MQHAFENMLWVKMSILCMKTITCNMSKNLFVHERICLCMWYLCNKYVSTHKSRHFQEFVGKGIGSFDVGSFCDFKVISRPWSLDVPSPLCYGLVHTILGNIAPVWVSDAFFSVHLTLSLDISLLTFILWVMVSYFLHLVCHLIVKSWFYLVSSHIENYLKIMLFS